MRACRHSQLHNACTVYIQVCLLLSALGYVRLCSISFRTTADTVAPRHSKKVSHAQYPIWRYMRACRHLQLHNACTVCKHVCLLLSALGYVRLCSTSFRTTADTVAPRQSKKVSHAQYPIWRYMRACRHSQLHNACTVCKQVCLLLSALGYVRLCSTSFRTTADTVAPRHSKR